MKSSWGKHIRQVFKCKEAWREKELKRYPWLAHFERLELGTWNDCYLVKKGPCFILASWKFDDIYLCSGHWEAFVNYLKKIQDTIPKFPFHRTELLKRLLEKGKWVNDTHITLVGFD